METDIRKYLIVLGLFVGASLVSCSGSDEDNKVAIVIPTDEDEECCSLDDELAMKRLFADYKEVEDLSGIKFSKYTIRIYSKYTTLHVGYNDLLFAVEKTETGQHVKDVKFSDLAPLMTMGMGMKHSAPIGSTLTQIDNLPVYHTWLSPLMASDETNGSFWELSFNYSIKGSEGKSNGVRFSVNSLPEGQVWLKSFKYKDHTYYLSLVNPETFVTGINIIQAYVSRNYEDNTLPYYEAPEEFIIEHTPTMPDMGDHTSPNNAPLTRQASGIYEGKLNLSMTGFWNIHLVVKDKDGNIVAGGENDSSGYSTLFWSITI